jgi:hypothetical protein
MGLHAVGARAEPTQRAAVAGLLDRLAVVSGAAEAVVVGGEETEWAAFATLLDCAAGVAAAAWHAVIAGAVVAQGAASHFREGEDRLLG